MAHHDGTTISAYEFFREFPDEQAAIERVERIRWDGAVTCPFCASERTTRLKDYQYHLCKDCRKKFTVRTGTIFERSHIPLDKWLYGMYILQTARKGVSSLQLSKELGITQKSTWFMLHRLREACDVEVDIMAGPVEADETYFGGKEGNKHEAKKLNAGRGAVGKVAVAGVKDRTTGQVKAKVVEHVDAPTLQGFVHGATEPTATVYTDEARAYEGLRRPHAVVKHSVKEFVNEMAHTNGIESVWAVMKRGYNGVYHHWSAKHLKRYVNEFTFRLGKGNVRRTTMQRLDSLVRGAMGKRLTYEKLIGPEYTRSPRIL